ncbi:hypothetical protein ACTG2I_13965 [Aeromonas caviae]
MDPKLGLKALGETCIKPLPGRGAAHLARQDLEEDETLVPAAGLVVGVMMSALAGKISRIWNLSFGGTSNTSTRVWW